MPVTEMDNNKAWAAMRAFNARDIDPVPDHLQEIAEKEKAYIFNIFHKEHRIDYVPGLGCVTIPACPDGKPYGDPVVIPGMLFEHYDAGNGKMLFRSWPAWSKQSRLGRHEPGVVDDILKPWMPVGMFTANLIQWGCFASTKEIPSKQELDKARAALTATAKRFIADGDRKSLQGERGRGEINSVNREMALFLNLKKPWLEEESTERDSCPLCGGGIMKGAAMCLHCKQRIDPIGLAEFHKAKA